MINFTKAPDEAYDFWTEERGSRDRDARWLGLVMRPDIEYAVQDLAQATSGFTPGMDIYQQRDILRPHAASLVAVMATSDLLRVPELLRRRTDRSLRHPLGERLSVDRRWHEQLGDLVVDMPASDLSQSRVHVSDRALEVVLPPAENPADAWYTNGIIYVQQLQPPVASDQPIQDRRKTVDLEGAAFKSQYTTLIPHLAAVSPHGN